MRSIEVVKISEVSDISRNLFDLIMRDVEVCHTHERIEAVRKLTQVVVGTVNLMNARVCNVNRDRFRVGDLAVGVAFFHFTT